jgi:hypothetical protein
MRLERVDLHFVFECNMVYSSIVRCCKAMGKLLQVCDSGSEKSEKKEEIMYVPGPLSHG